jgi:hypothetical protein
LFAREMRASSGKLQPIAPEAVQNGRVHARFLIAFCVGVAATLAFGDTARGMIERSSPRLSWLAPAAGPVPSSNQEELNAISFGLAAVRQRVDQLAGGQEPMTRDITKSWRRPSGTSLTKSTPYSHRGGPLPRREQRSDGSIGPA